MSLTKSLQLQSIHVAASFAVKNAITRRRRWDLTHQMAHRHWRALSSSSSSSSSSYWYQCHHHHHHHLQRLNWGGRVESLPHYSPRPILEPVKYLESDPSTQWVFSSDLSLWWEFEQARLTVILSHLSHLQSVPFASPDVWIRALDVFIFRVKVGKAL